MSVASSRRGAHGARPQDRNTSRPARCSSSANWHPVCPLPMISTFPGGSRSGSWYPVASSTDTRGGNPVAPGGRCGRWYAPVHTTTTRARISPDEVSNRNPPCPSACKDSTRTPWRTGRRAGGIPFQIGDNLVAPFTCPSGSVPSNGLAREIHRPVRPCRHQRETLPPVPPGLPDPRRFEHVMLDGPLGQLAADRQACLRPR